MPQEMQCLQDDQVLRTGGELAVIPFAWIRSSGAHILVHRFIFIQCQLAHWDEHKADCELNRLAAKLECTNLSVAAELFDDALYSQPPLSDEVLFQAPPPRDDCPICFHPLPLNADHFQYQPCCGMWHCFSANSALYDHLMPLPLLF